MVAHLLPKQRVAGSSPVARSKIPYKNLSYRKETQAAASVCI